MPKKKENKEEEKEIEVTIIKEEDISDQEIDEIKTIDRSIQIHTLNTQVQICSADPTDDLNKLKKIAESILDKYK